MAESKGRTSVDPMEAQYQAEFLRPPSEPAIGKAALAVVLYDLPAGSRPATEQAQRAYLQRYNSARQVSVTDGVQPKAIGGGVRRLRPADRLMEFTS